VGVCVRQRACVLAAIAAAWAFSPAKPPARAVYVTSRPPAGASADDVKGLEDAVRELRDAIAHRKSLRVVDDPAVADVGVEVTNREQRDAGEGGFGGIKLTPLGEMIIRFHARLTPHENGVPGGTPHSDSDEVDLKGIGPGYWSRAAKDGAERLEKWISNHAAPRKGAPYLEPLTSNLQPLTSNL
jgi:hypothetical protein